MTIKIGVIKTKQTETATKPLEIVKGPEVTLIAKEKAKIK